LWRDRLANSPCRQRVLSMIIIISICAQPLRAVLFPRQRQDQGYGTRFHPKLTSSWSGLKGLKIANMTVQPHLSSIIVPAK